MTVRDATEVGAVQSSTSRAAKVTWVGWNTLIRESTVGRSGDRSRGLGWPAGRSPSRSRKSGHPGAKV